MNLITKSLIESTEKNEWHFSDGILYKMCQENCSHNQISKIIGKILLIGRAYSASIERRKNVIDKNENFYLNKVAPKFQNSQIDFQIDKLKSYNQITESNIFEILKVHYYLTNLIKELTDQDKRSFSSKYLHFHLPHLFFIYDTRAKKALGLIEKNIKINTDFKELEDFDKEYATFFYKCFNLKNKLENEYSRKITLRHFDNLLMKIIEQNIK